VDEGKLVVAGPFDCGVIVYTIKEKTLLFGNNQDELVSLEQKKLGWLEILFVNNSSRNKGITNSSSIPR
jgi:hypothetical protein